MIDREQIENWDSLTDTWWCKPCGANGEGAPFPLACPECGDLNLNYYRLPARAKSQPSLK